MASVSTLLRTLLEDLGDACVNSYLSITESPKPVPSLIIPPSGPLPVLDCGGLLVVAVQSVTSAFQGPSEKCALVMQANLTVTVTRCISNLTDFGRPATQTALTTDGLLLAEDVSTLWYGLSEQCRLGTLWKSFTDLGCDSTRFREMRPGASGGIGWFQWAISVDFTSPLIVGLDAINWQSGEALDWESLESVDWTA